MLVECKYHDPSRYWFFLPHNSSGRWQFDDRVLNCGPYQTLEEPRVDTFLQLAPMSSAVIVVSEDGTKQENAAYTAIQQVANAFVPCALSWAFSYNIDYTNVAEGFEFVPDVDALIPLIVTNATLYRLKPEVTDLNVIRNAAGPSEVADELDWTWVYHDVPAVLERQNGDAIQKHAERFPELVYRLPGIEHAMRDFSNRPNWIAIANIASLPGLLRLITEKFLEVKTESVKTLLGPTRPRTRKRRV